MDSHYQATHNKHKFTFRYTKKLLFMTLFETE